MQERDSEPSSEAVKQPVDKLCQPPDLQPRRPTIEVPPGACDCHAHIYGAPGRYAYKPNRRYTPAAAGINDYRHMLSTLGIERAVLVQPGIYYDNQSTFDALVSAQGRWRGIAVLGPSVEESELDRLHQVGFRGVRFHPSRTKDGSRGLEEVAARIKAFGWHVQFNLDARDLVELGPRLERLPVDVVIDHFGYMPVSAGIAHPGFQYLLRMLKERHCWVKLSAPNRFSDPHPPYPSLIPYAQALIDAAPDRALWASDWPHSSSKNYEAYMPNDGELLDLLALWAPDAAVRRRILVDNPAALYGFASIQA